MNYHTTNMQPTNVLNASRRAGLPFTFDEAVKLEVIRQMLDEGEEIRPDQQAFLRDMRNFIDALFASSKRAR